MQVQAGVFVLVFASSATISLVFGQSSRFPPYEGYPYEAESRYEEESWTNPFKSMIDWFKNEWPKHEDNVVSTLKKIIKQDSESKDHPMPGEIISAMMSTYPDEGSMPAYVKDNLKKGLIAPKLLVELRNNNNGAIPDNVIVWALKQEKEDERSRKNGIESIFDDIIEGMDEDDNMMHGGHNSTNPW